MSAASGRSEDYIAGGLIIVQENNDNPLGSGNYFPDDEAGGSSLFFDIDSDNFTYNVFGLVIADLEETGWSIILTGIGTETATITYDDLMQGDATLDPGDNHINVLPFFDATDAEYGISALTRIEFSFEGSGSFAMLALGEKGVNEKETEALIPVIPEPAAASLVLLAGISILAAKRLFLKA